MAVKEPVIESVVSFRLRRSLFLIKLNAFTITNSEGVCDAVYLAIFKSFKHDYCVSGSVVGRSIGKWSVVGWLNTPPPPRKKNKNTGNQAHIITLLLDNITFLKDQLRQKDKVIDSLINFHKK